MNNDKQRKVIPLLKDIASRLWDGRAAVLVGAGFSRNAQPTSSHSRKFPMWNDLGDLFHDKIYCEKNNYRYSNVLKLADEVDAAFGRSTLDKIILDNVPDKEYEPSDLHKQLLNLPWADVFTTNYDTLLERTCVFVDSKKYDIVINKNDLTNAEKPRIIKLHGSFPSERPFIITEEDYRCYPKRFSPFVNTVQQALIENTLCLIGFSGDDPNFLNWIGWIRDNLDERNSPKIYLISLSDFNEAQRKLLEKRNIIIIDLSLLGDFNGNHLKAHTAFISFLNNNKKMELDINWPKQDSSQPQHIFHDDDLDTKKDKLTKVLRIWREDRKSYPGWCISPEDNRISLWRNTREWINIFDQVDDWKEGDDLDVAYEITWRINTCLLPIFDNTASKISCIVEKYVDTFKVKTSKIENISIKLPFLIISLLRYYRQEGDEKKWSKFFSLALECKEAFSLLDESKLNYESILFSYSKLKLDETFDKLSRWEKNELLPFMEAKRAGLLAELGHIDDAISILENALNTLRKNSFITSKNDDYSSTSQEAYIMLTLYYIKRNKPNSSTNPHEGYFSRWAKLSQYKCDPMSELKTFEIRLEGANNYNSNNPDYNNFDIGKRTTSLDFGFSRVKKIVLDSFSFLMFCEEIGLPPRTPALTIVKNTFGNAAAVIYEHCPKWALFTFLRIGDEKTIGNFFGRSLISKIGREDVQNTINLHFQALKHFQIKVKNLDNGKPSHLYNSFIRGISELLSRLVTKSSHHEKIEIIDHISNLYNDPNFIQLNQLNKLLERTINSLSNEKKIEALPLFLKFPVKPLNDRIREHEFSNPFFYITDLSKIESLNLKLKISNQDILSFIDEIKINHGTYRAISSIKMITLHKLGYINNPNTKKLIKSLWCERDEFGFPLDAGYHRFYFIKNLHPDDVDTSALMMRYIDQFNFPKIKKENGGIPIHNGRNEYCTELLGSINHIDLTSEKIEEISVKLNEWFDHDKSHLQRKDPEIRVEMEKKFENITRIISKLCFNFHEKLNEKTKENLKRLTTDMRVNGLHVTSAILLLNSHDKSSIHAEIENLCSSLQSTEKNVVINTLRSLSDLLATDVDSSEALICLSDKIKWNAAPEIGNCLRVSEKIINEKEFHKKDVFLKNLIIGLERIHEEQMRGDIEKSSYLESLETKINAAKAASSIYNKFKSGRNPIPQIILKWKALCESSEEFDEVKNSWTD